MIRLKSLLPLLLLPVLTFAQNLNLSVKSGLIAADKETPFLLRANQYGLVPIEPNFAYISARIAKEYDSTAKADYGFAIEPHYNAGLNNQQFLLPEAHIKAHWGVFDLFVGRKREIQGFVDTAGTMGSLIWSGNALPMTKVDLGFREFVPLKKGGLLAIKGNFAHGWFGQGDSVHNVLLHQKNLYARVGKPQWKIHLIAGFSHQAQWGGRPNTPFIDRISQQKIEKFPAGIKDFLSVATGISMTDLTGLDWSEQDGVPANEAGNRMGNHLGTVDIGLNLYPIKDLVVKIYRQSIFEDGSLFYLNNISDGLNGISFTYKKDYNFTFEYLDTRSQGGEGMSGNTIPELRGRDNYLNNSIYRDAWTYKNHIIGTPLFTMYRDRMDQFNYMSNTPPNYIYNNRVQAFSIKALYKVSAIHFSTHVIISNNLGTYRQPIQKGQFSFLQTGSYNFDTWSLQARIGIDSGFYFPISFGADLGVQWRVSW